MRLRRFALPTLAAGAVFWLAASWGCSGVNQIDENDLEQVLTLKVQYGDPGQSPDPCNDTLPIVDGVAQDQEWQAAEPIFLNMTGDRGNGGGDFVLEVRALWTDESRVGGQDRIYFMVRYQDDDQDIRPDQLAYGKMTQPSGTVRPSRPPLFDPANNLCDTLLVAPAGWDRLNPNGREDQVMMIWQELQDATTADLLNIDLIEANRALLGIVGPETPVGASISTTSPLDVWLFRAGRSNLHPIPQIPDWNNLNPITGLPGLEWSRFDNECGFAEDLYVNSGGAVIADAGKRPYAKNFVRRAPAPDRMQPCPTNTRDPSEEELAALNGGLANDLALWWPSSRTLNVCDTLACSRVGVPRKWSTRLLPGDYDQVQGWALDTPNGSARDVRTRATYEATQEKGFAVWTVEYMRNMNTGEPDDIKIENKDRTYRIVIGVLDASGSVGSGSTMVILEFAPPTPRVGAVRRC